MRKKNKYITVDKIFGESFTLYFKNIISLFIPSALIFSIFGLFFYQYFSYIMNSDETEIFGSSGIIFYFMAMFAIGIAMYIFFYIEIELASNAYRDIESNYREIISKSLRRFFPFLGMNILFSLGVSLAAILLIIPAYILMLGWCVAQVIFIIENERAIKSLKRSWNLTKGNKGKIFLLFLLIIAALYFVILIVSLIFLGISAGFQGNFARLQSQDFIKNGSLIMAGLMILFYSLLFPLFTVFLTVIYYNLKKDKEGYETELLAEEFMESETGESPI